MNSPLRKRKYISTIQAKRQKDEALGVVTEEVTTISQAKLRQRSLPVLKGRQQQVMENLKDGEDRKLLNKLQAAEFKALLGHPRAEAQMEALQSELPERILDLSLVSKTENSLGKGYRLKTPPTS